MTLGLVTFLRLGSVSIQSPFGLGWSPEKGEILGYCWRRGPFLRLASGEGWK